MADVTTYKRCLVNYVTGNNVSYHIGDLRAATDAAVVASPALWVALTDAEMASGRKGTHDS